MKTRSMGPSDEAKHSPSDEAKHSPSDEAKHSPSDEVNHSPSDEVNHSLSDEVNHSLSDEVNHSLSDEVNHSLLDEANHSLFDGVDLPLFTDTDIEAFIGSCRDGPCLNDQALQNEGNELDQLLHQHIADQAAHIVSQKAETEQLTNKLSLLENDVKMLRDQMPMNILLQQPPPPPPHNPPRSHSPVIPPSPISKKRRLDDEDFNEPSAKRLKTIERPLSEIIWPFLVRTGNNLCVWQISSVNEICTEDYQQYPKNVHLDICFRAIQSILSAGKHPQLVTDNMNRLKEHCVLAFTGNSYIYIHSYSYDRVVIGLCYDGEVQKNMVINRDFLPELEYALRYNCFNHMFIKCIQNHYGFIQMK